MQWENPPKIEWQTTLLQEKHRSCILWFSMQSLCWAKARAQPDRPSGAILAAFGRRQPPSRAAGLRPSLPAGPAKDPVSCLGRPLQTAGFSPGRAAVLADGLWRPVAAYGAAQRRRPCGPASGTNLSHRHPPQHRLQLPALQRRCQRRPGQGKLRRQTGRLF